MAFLETPRFPVDINYGSMGGPMFSTDVVRSGNGREYRNANWSLPLYTYDVRYSVKTRTQLVAIYEFFLAQQGRANGFRVKDLWDYTSNSDGKTAATVDDIDLNPNLDTYIASDTLQLFKPYTKGSVTINRDIKKPVIGSVNVKWSGVTKTEGVDYTVDYTTGIITFIGSPGAVSIYTGFEFDVPCRFDTDDLSSLTFVTYSTGGVDIASLESIPLVEIRV